MQQRHDFILIFKSKIYQFPFDSPLIQDVDPNIFNLIFYEKKYEIKSNVQEDTFLSFINYWFYRKVPIINDNNIDDYIMLSKEFDVMNSLIDIYLKSKIKHTNKPIDELAEKYHKIINLLFNNTGINSDSDYFEIRSKLYKACKKSNVELVDLLTRKKVLENNIIYVLNEKDKTASVFDSKDVKDIFIPQFIQHKGIEYTITSILENSLIRKCDECMLSKKVTISKDSKIRKIEKCSISYDYDDLMIPDSVEELENCSHYNNYLLKIKVSPKNKNFILFDDKYIIGKTDRKSDEFDSLVVFQSKDSEVNIPSFIKRIESYCFVNTYGNDTINIPFDSQLRIIESNAFTGTSITKLFIPEYLADLNDGWCEETKHLIEIKVHQNNKRFIYFQNKLLISKTNEESEEYDKVIFCRRDIEEIEIPSFIKIIGSYSFNKCDKLKSITFESNSNLEVIEKHSFSYSSIESISIPPTVKQIKRFAFAKCKNLKVFNIPNDSLLQKIDHDALFLSSIESIYIPENVVQIQNGLLEALGNLLNVSISPKNKCFKYIDDKFLVGKKDLKRDLYDSLVLVKRNVSEISIPSFIKYIEQYAFYSVKSIKNVYFPTNSNIQKIERFAFAYTSIESISIPSTVTDICKCAFYECKELKKVVFHENSKLQKIEKYAFSNSSIESIVIPSNVTIIGKYAFSECRNLKKVEFNGNSNLRIIEQFAFQKCPFNEFTIPSSVVYIGDYAFFNCFFDTFNIDSASKLRFIGKRAFYYSGLSTISIPPLVEKICEGAFNDCIRLKSVYIPENAKLKILEDMLFALSSIESFAVPSSVIIIGNETFKGCKNLKNVEFPKDSKLQIIGEAAFCNSNIVNITIPSSVTKICDAAFENCIKLENVNFSENSELISIGKYAFANADIKSINIPSHLKIISEYALSVYNLEKVDIQDDSELKTIEKNAFSESEIKSFFIPEYLADLNDGWCEETKHLIEIKVHQNNKRFIYFQNKLLISKTNEESEEYDKVIFCRRDIEEIEIPSFIKIIGSYSFNKCDKLKSITFESNSNLEVIEEDAFSYSSIESISIPPRVKSIKKNAFYSSQLKYVYFQPNSELEMIGKNAFSRTEIESISIPSNVTLIANHAFEYCEELTKVIISENSKLQIIGKKAFQGTAIKNFFIPANIVELKDGCFDYTTSLKEIKVSPKNKNYKNIENNLIVCKTDLKSDIYDYLLFCKRDIANITIPSYIKRIGKYSFHNCKYISHISFPQNSELEIIDDFAFYSSSILSFSIPKNVKTISRFSFDKCNKMILIEIDENTELSPMPEVNVKDSSIEYIMIPPNLLNIYKYTFIISDYDR